MPLLHDLGDATRALRLAAHERGISPGLALGSLLKGSSWHSPGIKQESVLLAWSSGCLGHATGEVDGGWKGRIAGAAIVELMSTLPQLPQAWQKLVFDPGSSARPGLGDGDPITTTSDYLRYTQRLWRGRKSWPCRRLRMSGFSWFLGQNLTV